MGTAVLDTPNTPDTLDTTQVEREIAEALDVGLLLDGRRYRRQTAITFERNLYTATAIRDTGLAKALQGFDPLHDEVSERIESLILDAFAAGSMYRFLSGALAEDEIPWTPDVAADAARRFKGLTDPSDQHALYEITSWVLLDFFLNAGGSWRTFLKYLSKSQGLRATQGTHETSASVVGDPNERSSSPNLAPMASEPSDDGREATRHSASGSR